MRPEDGDYSCPGPKKNAASWMGKDKSRFFLLCGHIDRQGQQLRNDSHGEEEVFCYRDMRNWDMREEKWRIERMAVTFPCTRTEDGFHICTYDFFRFFSFHPKRPTERKVESGCHFEGFSPSMTRVYADKCTSSKSHTLLTLSSINPPLNQPPHPLKRTYPPIRSSSKHGDRSSHTASPHIDTPRHK